MYWLAEFADGKCVLKMVVYRMAHSSFPRLRSIEILNESKFDFYLNDGRVVAGDRGR